MNLEDILNNMETDFFKFCSSADTFIAKQKKSCNHVFEKTGEHEKTCKYCILGREWTDKILIKLQKILK